MTESLKSSAGRVQEYLSRYDCDFVVKELPGSTRTAKDAAEGIGCSVSQIAKSLIFRDRISGNPVLVIASGSNRVSTSKIESVLDVRLDKADPDFVKARVGYAIGGVPPVAHLEPLLTILDPDLKNYDVIWAAAGTPNAVFELVPGDLTKLTGGRWVPLAK